MGVRRVFFKYVVVPSSVALVGVGLYQKRKQQACDFKRMDTPYLSIWTRLYRDFCRPILFTFLEPETAHRVTIQGLSYLGYVLPSRMPNQLGQSPRVAIAAGFDKNGDLIELIPKMVNFLNVDCEIGSVTNLPWEGNPKPRLFRLIEQEAIINRMGINNK